MAFEMVDRDQRLARRQRQPLAGEQPDHHPADQPRPGGRGDRVDLADRDVGLVRAPGGPGRAGSRHGRARRFRGRRRRTGGARRSARRPPGRGSAGRSSTSAAALSSQEDSRPRISAIERCPLPQAALCASAARDGPHLHPRHPRLAAGAGPGAHGRRRARGGAWLGARAASRSSPSRPAATGSRTGRWPRSAARRCGPRSSTCALLAGETDCSVHSMKDVESDRPADAAHRRDAAARRRPRPADRRRRRSTRCRRARVVGTSSPRRAAQLLRAPARPPDRVDPRQCRDAAGQARGGRGRRDPARRRRARPARARRGRQRRSRSTSCCRRRRRARSGSNAAPTTPRRAALLGAIDHADTIAAVAAERAFTLRAGRHLPFAGRRAGPDRRATRSTSRCEIFSEDGARAGRRDARASPSATSMRPPRWRGRCSSRAPAVDPPLVRGRMRQLLVLRPEPGAVGQRRARARAGARRRSPARCSRSSRSTGTRPIPRAFDALLLTSANALRHGGAAAGRADQRCRCIAVGEATADAARDAGFQRRDDRRATVSTRCSTRCPASLTPAPPRRRGSSRSGEPPRRSTTVIVYRSAPIADARSAAARRAGRRWSTARAPARGSPSWRTTAQPTAIAAISEAAAAACGAGWERSRSPTGPTMRALLALAARLCQDSTR